jgi:hypothetical protein
MLEEDRAKSLREIVQREKIDVTVRRSAFFPRVGF